MFRLGVFLLPLFVVLSPTGQASAQNVPNIFSTINKSVNSLFAAPTANTTNTSTSRPNQALFAPSNVATPKQDTSNMKVGGSMILNTSNATKNLMSVFNQNTSGTQLMGNRVIGYSEFPKEKDMPGVNTLTTYFHYRRPRAGGSN